MAIRIKKDWSKPYNRLGVVYLNKGDYAKALEYFNAFLRMDPGDFRSAERQVHDRGDREDQEMTGGRPVSI